MEIYPTGQTLAQVRETKAKIEGMVKTIKESVPADDPFAAQAAKAQLTQLYADYDHFVTRENDLMNLSKSLLATGKFIHEGPNIVPEAGEMRPPGFQVPEAKDKMKAHIAYSLGIDQASVDLDSGAPFGTRMKAAFFSAEKKPDFYESEFPGNVVTMKIAGKPVNFIKQGGKLIMADEHDFQFADVAEAGVALASEIPAIVASVASTIKAAPTGPLGMSIASGAGYTAVGTATDYIAEALFMKEDNRRGFGDVLGKRATEGMIGMVPEYGTGKLLQPLARRIGKGHKTDAVKTMDDAVRNLEKRGKITKDLKNRLDPFVGSSEEIQTRMTQIAQKSPGGGPGRTVFEARQALQDFRNMFASGEPGIPGKMFERAANNMMKAEDQAIAAIKSVDLELGTILEKEAKKKAESLLNQSSPIDTLGSTVKNLVREAEKVAIAEKNAAYEGFYRQADTAGVQFDPEDLANFIQTNYAKSGSTSSPVIEGVIKELRQRRLNAKNAAKMELAIPKIADPVKANRAVADLQRLQAKSGPLSALDFQNYHRTIKEDVPAGRFVAPTGAQVQGADAADALSSLFQSRINQVGLTDAWEAARVDLIDRLAFKGSAFKSLLRETPGGFAAMTDTQATQKLLSDPQYVNDFLAAIKTADPLNGARIEERMRYQVQNAYLNELGVGLDIGTGVKSIQFNDQMVMTLWGVNKKGEVNEHFGRAMVEKMKNLNQELKRLEVSPSKVTSDDIWALQSVLSKDGVKDAIGVITKRAGEAQKLEVIKHDNVMKMAVSAARRGNMDLVDLDVFPAAIFSEKNVGRIGDLMQYLDQPAKDALKVDTMKHFFRRYDIGSAAQKNDFGYTPWHAGQFLADVQTNPALATNLKKVIGKDGFDELVDMSTLAMTVRPVTFDKNAAIGTRFVADTERVGGYLAGNVAKAVGNAYLAAAYNAGTLMPTLRKMVGKRVTTADYQRNMKAMGATVFGTARGLESVFMVGRKDPDFIKWAAETGLGPEWMQETQDWREEYGTDRPDIFPK